MLKLQTLIPAMLVVASFSSPSDVQAATPYYTTSYTVEVKYEMWRNGASYWSELLETSDSREAEMTCELLLAALDNGTICQVMDCGFGWIIVDVRLVPHRTYVQIKKYPYISDLIYRR